MGATPGGGLSLLRLALVSSAATGFGLTDAVFVTFIIQVLIKAGASVLLAFLSIAAGGAISVLTAPLASVMSTTVNRRSAFSFGTLYIAAASCVGIAYIFSDFAVSNSASKPPWRIAAGITLSAIYRGAVQSSPIVPTVMNAAEIRGSDEEYPTRRDLSLSFFYLAYRLGFVTVSIIIAMLPDRMLGNLFPIMLTAAVASIILCTVSVNAMPREYTRAPLDNGKSVEPAPTMRDQFKEHLDVGLLKASRRLWACYIELFFYGIAFGQLGAITASFFNDVVFKSRISNEGLKWAAFSMLIGIGVNLVLDAILPIIVFRMTARKLKMKAAWAGGGFIGAVLFTALTFVSANVVAVVIFGALAITTSTHNLFSLISAGALVEPKFRATTFGVRAAFVSTGILIGSFAGGMIAEETGSFRWVMPLGAAASFLSGIAALFAGSVERMNYDGVAANANRLIRYTFKGE